MLSYSATKNHGRSRIFANVKWDEFQTCFPHNLAGKTGTEEPVCWLTTADINTEVARLGLAWHQLAVKGEKSDSS